MIIKNYRNVLLCFRLNEGLLHISIFLYLEMYLQRTALSLFCGMQPLFLISIFNAFRRIRM